MAGVGNAVVHDSAVVVDVGHADDRNPPRGLRRHRWLLRARHERPRDRRAAEQRDEHAALHVRGHSISSSASNCIELGTSMPRALTVLRLMTSSNLVGCSTRMRIW